MQKIKGSLCNMREHDIIKKGSSIKIKYENMKV